MGKMVKQTITSELSLKNGDYESVNFLELFILLGLICIWVSSNSHFERLKTYFSTRTFTCWPISDDSSIWPCSPKAIIINYYSYDFLQDSNLIHFILWETLLMTILVHNFHVSNLSTDFWLFSYWEHTRYLTDFYVFVSIFNLFH